MKLLKITLILLPALLLGRLSWAQDSVKTFKHNEFARFYAGLDQDSLSSIAHTKDNVAWKRHQESFTRFWDSAKIARIDPMTTFAKAELTILADSVKTLFYPFSGPDFLHANIFFPNAEKIVSLGLERVGHVPDIEDLNDKQLGTFFKAMRRSLDSIFIWGYFMTNDMSKDFARSLELKGVVPVVMMMMAKSGFIVENVRKITINSKGEIVDKLPGQKDLDNPHDNYISGAEIRYRKENDTIERFYYYFSHDASDESLKHTPQFVKFLSQQNFDASYFKAASYLCSWLNTIRKEALKAHLVFQDDSGIEIKYFDEKTWSRQLWGTYSRPIKQFKWAKQPKLVEIYKTDANVRPLPFGIGYCARFKEGNLMLFTRK